MSDQSMKLTFDDTKYMLAPFDGRPYFNKDNFMIGALGYPARGKTSFLNVLLADQQILSKSEDKPEVESVSSTSYIDAYKVEKYPIKHKNKEKVLSFQFLDSNGNFFAKTKEDDDLMEHFIGGLKLHTPLERAIESNDYKPAWKTAPDRSNALTHVILFANARDLISLNPNEAFLAFIGWKDPSESVKPSPDVVDQLRVRWSRIVRSFQKISGLDVMKVVFRVAIVVTHLDMIPPKDQIHFRKSVNQWIRVCPPGEPMFQSNIVFGQMNCKWNFEKLKEREKLLWDWQKNNWEFIMQNNPAIIDQKFANDTGIQSFWNPFEDCHECQVVGNHACNSFTDQTKRVCWIVA